MKKARLYPIVRMSFLNMFRRKFSSMLQIGVMLVATLTCVVLGSLYIRQEKALGKTIDNTEIRCTVTNINGRTNNIQVLSTWIDMLTGKRQDNEGNLQVHVKEINCMAKEILVAPKDVELRRIYTFDSDLELQQMSGAVISLYEGWSEECLKGTEKVCIIAESLLPYVQNNGEVENFRIQTKDGQNVELQVIGQVSGLSENVLYCPFYMEFQESVTTVSLLDSCSFIIRDNSELDAAKEELYQYFSKPVKGISSDSSKAGLLVQDETYLASVTEIKNNLALLKILLPFLFVMTACINFFAEFLINRRHLKEFAVMRCIGQKRSDIFVRTLLEQGILTMTGSIFGGIISCIFVTISWQIFRIAAITMIIGLLGSIGSALQMSSINPIGLMKTEE